MERRSGFRECPKCGLRNKPGVTQCDFCGQNLGPSDDWQQHIKDLESLNKMEMGKPVDDRTSKRIEATIIRKDAPAVRNMEIREAGNLGKALRELDELPAREKARDARDDRYRQPSVQDKLRIKEVGSIPLVERGTEETPPADTGTTIADLLREPPKELVIGTETEEPPALETERIPEPAVVKAPEEPAGEIDGPLPVAESPPEPVTAEEVQTPAEGRSVDERAEEPSLPSAAPEPDMENVPAKEVTLEVAQPPQEELPTAESSSGGVGEVAISTNDSHETIKLKLVKVERPKERLTPTAILPRLGPRGRAAIAMLALGMVAYLAVLTMAALGYLNTAAGIGGGALSSCLIIYGTAVVYPSLRKRKENEVYICPKCHEKVDESSDGCPACGAEFESED